ncbi:Transposon Tf2-9 polyprotein, partial [Glycine soja]
GVLRLRDRICVSNVPKLRKMILEEGHRSNLSIHPGATKMYQDLKMMFWWPNMKKEVSEFVYACLVCHKAKIEHHRPSGKLQPLEIPQWKWDSISMDFVVGLPRTPRGLDYIWVIVDRLTKSTHFIPINIKFSLEKLTTLYISEVIRLHGVPSSIVSDRDPRFTSRFWESLNRVLGTKLRLSSAYHPQTDGQTERTIQSLEDLLKACVLEQKESWESFLPLIEFTYDNSFHSTIGMVPYEALYGRRCRTPLCWLEPGEGLTLGPKVVQQTTEKVKLIEERMRTAQSRQKSYHDKRRKDLEFEVGDHVFLRVTPWTGAGRALKSRKLTPRFIGPFQILKRVGPLAYQIALPPSLSNLHNVFHVSQVRKYIRDPSHVIELDDVQVKENLTYETLPLRIEDRRTKHLRGKEISLVKPPLATTNHRCSPLKPHTKRNPSTEAESSNLACGFGRERNPNLTFHFLSRYGWTCFHMKFVGIGFLGDMMGSSTRFMPYEWYLEICRRGQETLGMSGGVLLPKTKLDQSRPNSGIVRLKNGDRKLKWPLVIDYQGCVIDYRA